VAPTLLYSTLTMKGNCIMATPVFNARIRVSVEPRPSDDDLLKQEQDLTVILTDTIREYEEYFNARYFPFKYKFEVIQ
jgi:hypothetical protein